MDETVNRGDITKQLKSYMPNTSTMGQKNEKVNSFIIRHSAVFINLRQSKLICTDWLAVFLINEIKTLSLSM